jgi:hypothetical protein
LRRSSGSPLVVYMGFVAFTAVLVVVMTAVMKVLGL